MKRIHRILLAILSGILLSLPWLGFPGWTLFFALLPLLFLNAFFVKHKASFPPFLFWGHLFLAALVWNVAASWWMTKASFLGVFSAMLLNASFLSAVGILAHTIHRKFSSSLGFIALLAFWLSFEYLQMNWDLEWPCLQLGSVLAYHIKWIQWYEYTGTFGGSFWILLLNLLLFSAIRKSNSTPSLWFSWLMVVAMVLLPICISGIMYSSYTEEGEAIEIAIVQPNVDPYLENYDMEAEKIKLEKFLKLAAEVTTDQTQILIGPETIFENQWYWNEEKLPANSFLNKMLDFIRGFEKTELLFGASTYKFYANKNEASYTARNKDGMYYDRYSTALYALRNGEVQLQHKSKLVMGVEKTPFIRYFPFLKNIFIDLGGTSGSLGYDQEPVNFVTQDGSSIAPVICFESVFGEYVAKKVYKGAELIVVITNDGWWKGSRGYKQHLLFSQLRAIETRRSIARAANTGTSCFINQRGDILQATEWWKEAAMQGTIVKNDKVTFYSKHGDFIGRGAIFTAVFLLLMVFVKRFK